MATGPGQWDHDGHGRTVLITGASAGIGAAFAHVFARHGYTLILTARRTDRLEGLAGTLTQQYGVTVHSIPADLSDPHTPEILVEKTRALGLPIDVLVNNAGYGLPYKFSETPWQTQMDFLQVMATSVVHLSHLVLPDMMARGYGRIMNVSSAAGYMPGSSGATLYIPMKSFLIKFSQSLVLELEGTGVHVMALCPGFTYSEFHDVTGSRAEMDKMPKILWMGAERVAEEGYAALMAGKRPVYVNGWVNRVLVALAKYLPSSVVLAIAGARRDKDG